MKMNDDEWKANQEIAMIKKSHSRKYGIRW